MPHRLLLLLPRGGGLLFPTLRRSSPAPSYPPWCISSAALPRTFFFSRIRAFSCSSGIPVGSPEQQQRSVEVRETVELTEKEEGIFRRLLDVVRHFDLGTQPRVAGGWVRDKMSY